MGSLLSEFLSSRGKPVICNGKLLKHGKQLVFARESANYSVIFTSTARSETAAQRGELNLTSGEGLKESEIITEASLISSALDFDRKYAFDFGRDPEQVDARTLQISVDPFTNALVIESQLYAAMMDPDTFHRTNVQYDERGRAIRAELLLDYLNNYYDIFGYLFNKRIMSTHSPSIVKGHLIAGLFQPLVCSTKCIRSPFDYPILNGMHALISGDFIGNTDGLGNIEEQLEPSDTFDRGVRLSCVSTYDLVHRFAPPNADPAELVVPKMMDRRMYMYILLLLLSGIVINASGLSTPPDMPLETKHPVRMQEVNESPIYNQFLTNLANGYMAKANQLVSTK